MNYLQYAFEFILTMIAIDFVSGLVHWAEDTFGSEQTPIIGKWIVLPNVVHHEKPNDFVKKNWVQSSWDLILASSLIVLVAWYFDRLTWHIWLFSFFGAIANQLHKFAHLPKSKVPRVVKLFQAIGLLQSARHHAIHHQVLKNTAYCVVTPYLNPVLDKIGFWRGLEKITVPIFGAPRREDLTKG